MRALDPALTGAGVAVAQVEASDGSNGPLSFEASPGTNPTASFTYINGTASTTSYNDGSVGAASAHATYVATFFYAATLYQGEPTGVAPGVTDITLYDANSFLTNLAQPGFAAKVVNLSFTYTVNTTLSVPQQQQQTLQEQSAYDTAARSFNTIFVAADGNGGTPAAPASAYNVIAVASSTTLLATGAAGLYGDKPDISAPQSETSYTTPIVAGAATLLVQAGTTGLTGWTSAEKSDAVDFRTVKALLLNSAVKPADYFTNAYAPGANQPLSAEYGSGVVNVYNAVVELYAGEDTQQSTATIATNAAVYTSLSTDTALSPQGWNLATLTATRGHDAVGGYAVSLTAGGTFIATITWAASTSNTLNKFDLYLYNEATGSLVASSTASASAVQQIDTTPTAAGRYDLFVRLEGSTTASLTDTYALAFADTIACFAEGTAIATPAGDTPVEQLRAGDRVTLARTGAEARIRRISRRSLLHPARQHAPLEIRPHSFGPGRPRRALRLSPEHAVYTEIGGSPALVPIRALENGTSITRLSLPSVTYFHILLDTHDVLLAEGLPCESLLDPEALGFDDAPPEALAMPRLTQGALVEQLREKVRSSFFVKKEPKKLLFV